jgi:hypothetical protein
VQDLWSRVPSHDLVALAFFVLTFLAGVIVWLSLQWRLHRRTELEVALKQDMVARGMSAADIERVLGARLGGTSENTANAAPARHPG